LARHALSEMGLTRVLVMPAHIPPHKPASDSASGGSDPGPEHRLRMCQLLVARQHEWQPAIQPAPAKRFPVR